MRVPLERFCGSLSLNRMRSRIKSSIALPGHKRDMEAADIALRAKKSMGVPQVRHLDESTENSTLLTTKRQPQNHRKFLIHWFWYNEVFLGRIGLLMFWDFWGGFVVAVVVVGCVLLAFIICLLLCLFGFLFVCSFLFGAFTFVLVFLDFFFF